MIVRRVYLRVFSRGVDVYRMVGVICICVCCGGVDVCELIINFVCWVCVVIG